MSKLKSVIKVSEPFTKAHTLCWKRAINNTTNPHIRLPINKAAAAVCQFLPTAISGSRLCAVFANSTNIVANWVKKQHKIDENSSIVFKWQILAKESTI